MTRPVRPLDGVRVVELSSMAPAPFCAMILGDFGADVVLIERPGGNRGGIKLNGAPLFSRGKRSVVADLTTTRGQEVARTLVEHADVLIEGYRPGVAERLGMGPAKLLSTNPRLIYTRVTGWGQDGPYAQRAGHDINYIAVAGALAEIGVEEPVPPSAFLGDFAGGSLVAVIGVLLALRAREITGRGQVIDSAIMDGANLLMQGILELRDHGEYLPRGENFVDGRAPFYGAYKCSDGNWYAVGAIEPQFYSNFLEVLGLGEVSVADQLDRSLWPALRSRVAAVFLTETRDEWEERFAQVDACGSPVLSIDDLPTHPQTVARHRLSASVDGGWQVAPAPLLSETPGQVGGPYSVAKVSPENLLSGLGWLRAE